MQRTRISDGDIAIVLCLAVTGCGSRPSEMPAVGSADTSPGAAGAPATTLDTGRDAASNANRDAATLGSPAAAEARDSGQTLDAGADAAIAREDAGAANAGPRQTVPPGGYALFPASGALDVCPDPPLRVAFAGPPTLGTAGKIRVFDAGGSGAMVASVDLGASTWSATVGGVKLNLARPAYVDDNEAVIYLPPHVLAYGRSSRRPTTTT